MVQILRCAKQLGLGIVGASMLMGGLLSSSSLAGDGRRDCDRESYEIRRMRFFELGIGTWEEICALEKVEHKDQAADSLESVYLDQLAVSQFSESMRDQVQSWLHESLGSRSFDPRQLTGLLIYTSMNVLDHYYGVKAAKPIAMLFNAILVADFVTGFFHWMEDTYFDQDTPVIGEVIKNNRLHHEIPGRINDNTPYETIRESAIAASIIGVVLSQLVDSKHHAFIFSTLSWGALANQIHQFAHLPPSSRPWFAGLLQGYFFQTPREHKVHHTNTEHNYCIMTDHLNPVLEQTRFWRFVEYLIEKVTGVAPRLHELTQLPPRSKL